MVKLGCSGHANTPRKITNRLNKRPHQSLESDPLSNLLENVDKDLCSCC